MVSFAEYHCSHATRQREPIIPESRGCTAVGGPSQNSISTPRWRRAVNVPPPIRVHSQRPRVTGSVLVVLNVLHGAKKVKFDNRKVVERQAERSGHLDIVGWVTLNVNLNVHLRGVTGAYYVPWKCRPKSKRRMIRHRPSAVGARKSGSRRTWRRGALERVRATGRVLDIGQSQKDVVATRHTGANDRVATTATRLSQLDRRGTDRVVRFRTDYFGGGHQLPGSYDRAAALPAPAEVSRALRVEFDRQ